MNIAGDKEKFAIQWAFDDCHGPYYYGHLCFWIDDKKVGNFDETTTLSIAASYLRDFLKNKSLRTFNESKDLTKDQLFYLLYDKFFSGSWNEYEHRDLGNYREIFWLDEPGESSFRDKLGMVLVDEPDLSRQRLIWKTFSDGQIKEYFIPADYFDNVAKEFLQQLDPILRSGKS